MDLEKHANRPSSFEQAVLRVPSVPERFENRNAAYKQLFEPQPSSFEIPAILWRKM